jgi:hypothetical protein
MKVVERRRIEQVAGCHVDDHKLRHGTNKHNLCMLATSAAGCINEVRSCAEHDRMDTL